MGLLGGNLQDLGNSRWGSASRMTGPFLPRTVTLKRDERSSCRHFSSSNWAAIIREGPPSHPPPLSLFSTSPYPAFFDFRWAGEECQRTLGSGLFFPCPSLPAYALLLVCEGSGECFISSILFAEAQFSFLCCNNRMQEYLYSYHHKYTSFYFCNSMTLPTVAHHGIHLPVFFFLMWRCGCVLCSKPSGWARRQGAVCCHLFFETKVLCCYQTPIRYGELSVRSALCTK